MVSSTVYGMEDLLNQIFATLQGYGYTVWMSHRGTIPLNPNNSNFDNCLEAVDQCDAFLGIINGRYGSGVYPAEDSITHQEIRRAIARNKLRWFLVHHNVIIARELLKQFRFNDDGTPKDLHFRRTNIIDDIRVLEMYECAIRSDVELTERTGNWAHPYTNHEDALRFIGVQLANPKTIQKLLRERPEIRND